MILGIERVIVNFNGQGWRLWVEIEAHKWRDLELNLSKTVEELCQDSQLIQANSKKKLIVCIRKDHRVCFYFVINKS